MYTPVTLLAERLTERHGAGCDGRPPPRCKPRRRERRGAAFVGGTCSSQEASVVALDRGELPEIVLARPDVSPISGLRGLARHLTRGLGRLQRPPRAPRHLGVARRDGRGGWRAGCEKRPCRVDAYPYCSYILSSSSGSCLLCAVYLAISFHPAHH